MKERDDIIERTVQLKEKGYVNDPSDSGGETMWGITANTAKASRHLWYDFGFEGDMRELPLGLAYEIYARKYWNEMYLDEVAVIDLALAEKLFDIGVNYSTRAGQAWLQRCLNVLNDGGAYYDDLFVDGDIGPATIVALRAYVQKRKGEGKAVLYTMITGLLTNHYITLAERRVKDEKFVFGWMRARVVEDLRTLFKF